MAETEMPSASYLKPNSHKYKEEQAEKEERHVEKVVKGKASVRKKPIGKRVQQAMLGEDVAEVKSYLIWDVLIPALKDTVVDLIKKGADALFYGSSSQPANVKRSGNVTRVSYSGYYNDRRQPRRPTYNRRAAHDFEDILFDDRRDAEEVLSNLVELTMSYGMASVADFYELAGTDSDFTDNKYGWGELSEARVVRVRDGYVIHLPKPEPID